MGPVVILLFGIIAYLIAMASVAYAIGFVANYWVPKSIDSGSVGPLGEALGVNVDQVYRAKSRILKRLAALVEQQVSEEG